MKKTDSFEAKLEYAKELLDKLSTPEITMEESIKYYKDGIKILKEASQILENAKIEIQEISTQNENN